MSAELLLELPSKVVKVFALPQAPGASFQKSALVIVQSDSVSVAHGENGSLYHHYNFGRKTSYGAIVDCVYLFHQRQFLVAFQDSSLVVVPLDCKDVALCERAVWPKQPLKLQSVDGKSASLYCDGGYVCVVTISEEGSLPAAPTSWSERSLTQVSKESVFVQANSRYVASVSLRTSPAASSSVTPSKKKANAKKDSDSENTEYSLSVWSVPTLLSGASALLTAQSATTSTLALQAGETVVSVVFHARADSLSVITTTEKSSGRWLKVAVDGTILFERALSSVTSNAGDFSEVGDQLAVVTADRVLKYFDVRYGTEVRSVALSDSTANSPVSASWVLLFETDANKSSSAGGPASVQIFTSKMLKTSGPFNLYRRTLGVQTASALSSSLCQSIGKLAATTAENAAAAPLPAAQKRQLQDVSAQYQSQVQSEAAQDLKDLMDPAERQERKHRRLSVDVPQDAAKAFLTKFEARGKDAAAVEAWEWDLVKVLARSGDLSVSRNPALITTAAAAKRIDVLAAIVEYVPDLSEKLCVRILAHLMLVAEADLAQLTVVDGIIHWSEQAQEKATDKKKTPKKASKAEEVSAGSEDRRLDLLRALVESTLRRASAFSAILLGEAVRALPLPCAVLLLQVVTHFVRGLCGGADSDEVTTTPVVDTRKVHLHAYVTDEEIKRAATWAEALLDGHFSALALHAVGHAGTRRALTYAMGTISGAEDGSELVQSTLGLWTHITRVIHNGGQQVKPITSLYQVEQLDLR